MKPAKLLAILAIAAVLVMSAGTLVLVSAVEPIRGPQAALAPPTTVHGIVTAYVVPPPTTRTGMVQVNVLP
ncbi:MAG: hypothetical protein QXL81_03085 [Candidatus Aenigmatarchaeota archaeon]